ncbi:MAG: ABC transporter permease [Anaerococcus sp.]|nr:ABC transporter permease [Anaerococcus sp.]
MNNKKSLKSIILNYSIYIILIVLILSFAYASPMFLSQGNISNFFRQIPSIGLLTVAYTMILITGNVDLSIASIAAFCGTAAAFLAKIRVNPILTVIISISIGGLLGLINGLLITNFDLPSFILTLGTNYVYRGLIMFLTNGIYITGMPDWFAKLSQTKLLSNIVYTNTAIFIVITLLFSYVLKRTDFGRKCYAVGSNKEASRLSGIKANEHIIKTYIIEGMIAAVAGILIMSNLNVGGPNEGQGLDLLAMAGAILGGTQFSGGVGTIGGAIVGILTLQIFTNGLAILGVNTFMQQVVTGLVIIVALIVDYIRRKYELKN